MITISSTRVRDDLGEAVAMVEPTLGSSLPLPVRARNFYAGVIGISPLGACDVVRREARAMSRRTALMAMLSSSSNGIECLVQTALQRKPFPIEVLEPLRNVPPAELSSDQLAYAVAEWRWRSAHVIAAGKGEVEYRTRDAFIPAWFFEGA